jgi:hypothetical protein
MSTFQKISLGLVAALVTAIIMIGIQNATGWEIGLLIGWFPVTSWFATWKYIKYKEGVPIKKVSFLKVLIAFSAVLIICIIGSIFKTPQIVLGIICSVIYNVAMLNNIKKEK